VVPLTGNKNFFEKILFIICLKIQCLFVATSTILFVQGLKTRGKKISSTSKGTFRPKLRLKDKSSPNNEASPAPTSQASNDYRCILELIKNEESKCRCNPWAINFPREKNSTQTTTFLLLRKPNEMFNAQSKANLELLLAL